MEKDNRLYTIQWDEDSGKMDLVHRVYTGQAVEEFKKKAVGLYYHVVYHYKGVEDHWHCLSNSYDSDSFFLDIPIEDYVIEDGELVGFYPYHGTKKLKENIIELLCQETNGILWLCRDACAGREAIVQLHNEKRGVRWRFPLWETMETVWQIYKYTTSGRLIDSNVAFRWDEKDTLMLLGNMRMPEYRENDIYPWEFFKEKIKHIIIMPGIVEVHGFHGCKHLESVFIPGTVDCLGDDFSGEVLGECYIYVLAGSGSAEKKYGKNMKKVILDVKKDAGWLMEKYGIDLVEDYYHLWERRIFQYESAEREIKKGIEDICSKSIILSRIISEKRETEKALQDMMQEKSLELAEKSKNSMWINEEKKQHQRLYCQDVFERLMLQLKFLAENELKMSGEEDGSSD